MKKSGVSKKESDILKSEIRKIESIINKLFNSRKPRSLYEPCHYLLESGGKRLRPSLVLLSASAVNGQFANVRNAAAAVELVHNFTLVHDDIMDNSNLRRGRPTIHNKYDLSTAILTGDSLIAFAYEILLKDCSNNSKDVISIFNKGIVEVCEGQSLDKEFEIRNSVSIDEYKVMIYKKTAAMLEMCCGVGGILGGGSQKEVQSLAAFGKNIGMAFQIQDDLLDITADESEFGKPVGADLVEGKKTFLFLSALKKVKGKDKKILLRVIKNKGINKKEVPLYKKIYEDYGILEDAKKEIGRFTKLALKNLNTLSDNSGKASLQKLANSLMNRIK